MVWMAGDACDVGVEFECSVEPLTEDFRDLDNSAKTARFAENDELGELDRTGG
jgi:hypothetical protein